MSRVQVLGFGAKDSGFRGFASRVLWCCVTSEQDFNA